MGSKKLSLDVVSDARRAELAEVLRSMVRALPMSERREAELHEAAEALTGPTKRELDLDELLHSGYVETLLTFAEVRGRDAAPVAAREFRAWQERIS